MADSALASVYVSYKWEGESQALVDRLASACKARAIELIRDTETLRYKECIKGFMRDLGSGRCVVVVLSDAYLKSENCMYELLEIERNRDFHARVFPIVLPGCAIYKTRDRVRYHEYWQTEEIGLQEALRSLPYQDNLDQMREAHNFFDEVRRAIDNLMAILSDMNTLGRDVHEASDFAELLDAIEARLEQIDQSAKASSSASPRRSKPARKVAAKKAAKGPARKRPMPSEPPRAVKLRAEVRERLEQLLGRKSAETFARILARLVDRKLTRTEASRSDQPEARPLADRLLDLSLGDQVAAIGQAYRELVETLGSPMRPSAAIDEEWRLAEDLVGWVVLLAVRDDWCDGHERLLAQSGGFVLDLPLSEKLSQSVAFSRLKQVKAELRTRGEGPSGRRRLEPAALHIERGWAVDDRVDFVKGEIWRQVILNKPVPHPFEPAHDDYLNARLEARNARDDPPFLPIDLDDGHSAFGDREVIAKLSEDLKALHILTIRRGDATEVLLVTEEQLSARLDDFLSLSRDATATRNPDDHG